MSTGWPAVRDQCAAFGDSFDEWQDGAGRAILAKRDNGQYAATVGGITLSIPRQVAKTFLVGRIVFALCIIFPGLQVIWTAHRQRTATSSFRSLMGYARRKKVWPHIEHIRTANGEQEIAFKNGSIILFGAREQGFGRGFPEIDILVFDEAQILTEKALEDMVPATNQSRHPHGALVFFMGTPPRPTDPGESFTLRRDKALSGKSDDLVYIEMSADEDADPDDRKQWAKANPSYPIHTPEQAILRMREILGDESSFLREALGIWTAKRRTLDIGDWLLLADPDAKRGTRPSFGVDIGTDRLTHVGVAWKRPDGVVQTMLADTGLSPLKTPSRLRDLAADWKGQVILGGPSAALEDEVKGAKVLSAAEFASACGRFDDLFRAGLLRHGNQHELNEAVNAAKWRAYGQSGERVIQLRDAPAVGPLAAVIRAVAGVLDDVPPAKPKAERAAAVPRGGDDLASMGF